MSTPPIPAQSLEPLSYQVPPVSRRPGILTAVGIISIVIGCLSGLSSCGGVASATMFLTMRNLTIPMPPPPTPARTKGAGVAIGDRVVSNPAVLIGGLEHDLTDTENGLDPAVSNNVAGALMRVQTFTGTRRGHLMLLLGAHGKTMFPTVGPNSTSAEFRNAVTAGGMTNDGANWYTVGTGRIEINDQRALYRPSDGGGEVAEASTSGQTSAALGGSSKDFAKIALPPPGAAGTPTTAPAPMPIMPFKIDPSVAIVSIVENSVSLLVAVLLLVAGILVLRDSPKARRLHWIYVIVKIPLIAVAAVATAMMTAGMMNGMLAPRGGAPGAIYPSWMAFMQAAFGAGMALIYPLALIFVLNTRAVRAYYAPPTPPDSV